MGVERERHEAPVRVAPRVRWEIVVGPVRFGKRGGRDPQCIRRFRILAAIVRAGSATDLSAETLNRDLTMDLMRVVVAR